MISKVAKGTLLALAIAALGACSTLTTSTDYDKTADFTKFKTYQWKDTDPGQNAILEKRIKEAVDSALSSKGLRRVEDGGDLTVVPHVRLSKETQINTYNTGWGYGGWYGYGGYGGGGMTTSKVEEIPVGTLIVDLVDAGKKAMVWRGTASDTLNPSNSPEEKEKNLNNAVQKMFEGYPPAPKK